MLHLKDYSRINYVKLSNNLKSFEKEYLPLMSVELKDQYKELLKTQENLKSDLVFMSAARMVRFLQTGYLKFLDDLKCAGENNKPKIQFSLLDVFSHFPIMIPSVNVGYVYVFPNLIVDKIDKSNLENTCWLICFNTLETFNITRTKKSNSWAPFFRAWRKIKKYEEISIVRALRRYTNIEAKLDHEKIDSLVSSYIDLIKPLKLLYAEKAADYMGMFKEGGASSCMTIHGDKRTVWAELLKHNHHPMSLFAYHPYIKGVYCVKNNMVVARTLLYQNNKGVWEYGRIFSINGFYTTKFKDILQKVNYIPLSRSFRREIEFKVPGLWSDYLKSYLLPVPYIDDVFAYVNGKFDQKKKQFSITFLSAEGKTNINVRSTGGFIRDSQLTIALCVHCGDDSRDGPVSHDGLMRFCSTSCARSSGYVYALTHRGENQLRPIISCFRDYFNTDHMFTNINSCRENGGVAIIETFTVAYNKIVAVNLVRDELSVEGTRVEYCGKTLCINEDMYRDLVNKRLVNSSYQLVCTSPGVYQ